MKKILYDSFSNEDEEFDNIKEAFNLITDGTIVAIVDLGLWNGRKQGYKLLNDNLNEIFSIVIHGDLQIYYDGINLRGINHHHDGTNYILFREFKPNVNKDILLDTIYSGNIIPTNMLNNYTKSLKPYVKKIIGG